MACSNPPDVLTLDALRDDAHLQLLGGDLELLRMVVEELDASGHAKLGDLGERVATEFLENAGWHDPGFSPAHQGIDRVLVHESGRAAIIEVKTTFEGQPRLSKTGDGRQLSDRWVETRLMRMGDSSHSQGAGQNPLLAETLHSIGLDHIERLLVVTRFGGVERDVDVYNVDANGDVSSEVDLYSVQAEDGEFATTETPR